MKIPLGIFCIIFINLIFMKAIVTIEDYSTEKIETTSTFMTEHTTETDYLSSTGVEETTQQYCESKPICQTKIIEDKSAKLKCEVGFDTSKCQIKEIALICEAKLEDNNLNAPWIESIQKNYTFKLEEQSTTQDINLEDLSPFTNYTCLVHFVNDINHAHSSEFKLLTTEGLPGKPQNLIISNQSSENFTVQWKPPNYIPGILRGYKIVINNVTSNHFIPSECGSINIKSVNETLDPNAQQYLFQSGLPDFTFTVELYAETVRGRGLSEIISGTTLTSVPQQPRNVEFKMHYNGGEYNFSASITWLYPCNSNGKLTHFKLESSAESILSKKNRFEESATIELNDDLNIITYGYTVKNLRPFHSYTIKVYSVLDTGITSFTEVTFLSPKDDQPTVENLKYDGNGTLAWLSSKKSQKYKYNIYKGEDQVAQNVNTTFYNTGMELFCTSFTVESVSEDNNKINHTIYLKPGPVEDIHLVEKTESSLSIAWKPPIDSSCVDTYKVKLNNKEIFRNSILNYTYTELEACTRYNLSVSAMSINDIESDDKSLAAETGVVKPLPVITGLKVELVSNTSFNCTWSKPIQHAACVDEYKTTIHSGSTEQFFELETYFFYDKAVACENYKVNVIVRNGFNEGPISPTVDYIHPAREPTSPICAPIEKEDIWAKVECEMGFDTNKCQINKIEFKCNVREEDNNLDAPWIDTSEKVYVYNLEDQTNKQIFDFQNLSPFTNYTCLVKTVNNIGHSDSTEFKLFTTEGVPGKPQNLSVTNQSFDNFTVQWEPPSYIPGILKGYSIEINNGRSNHFIPSDCGITDQEIIKENFNADEQDYLFNSGFPDFTYSIELYAKTGKGNGISEKIEGATLSSVPEQPRNADSKIEDNGGEYNFSASITWLYPCNSNGNLTHFKFESIGVPLVDKGSPIGENATIELNEDINNITYGFALNTLLPFHSYKVKIYSVLDTAEESFTEVTFNSPQGKPGSPFLHNVTDITETSFKVVWDTPDVLNGELTEYNINIKCIGPLYITTCTPVCNDLFNETIQDVKSNYYNFTKARPYHSYDVKIRAKTSGGYGVYSNNVTAETKEFIPEPIQIEKIFVEKPQIENFDAKVYVVLKLPCNIYGIFNTSYIKLEGKRNETIIDTKELYENDTFIKVYNLKAECNYTIDITLKTLTHSSPLAREYFQTYANVPKLSGEPIKTPEVNGPTNATFTLNSTVFDDINGIIRYYAILLGDFKSQSTFGFWDHKDSNTWPLPDIATTKETLENEIIPYQATQKYWNPFEDGITTYKFVIGNGFCDADEGYCNAQLKANTKYFVKLRGFTAIGYKDTNTVSFITAANFDDSINLGTVLGLVFGIGGAAVLLGFMFLLWKRRQNREKRGFDEPSLIPIPISVKQFPSYYMSFKANSTRLKNEYTLLNSKSSENTLPSQVAILLENKKKNRYINILPYDATRVVIDDNDENEAGYINASYISGYSAEKEYIATQGPVPSTIFDFWNMVLQEKVHLIVMVAQFVELGKEKCARYIPNNQNNLELSDDLELRCMNELDFGWYCIRTILVQKNTITQTVTHLQFLEWPDFGCPTGTKNMIEFCTLMRKHVNKGADRPTIVHCSAGVGRTGTIIALDILFQTIKDKKDIDIFGTILNLRRQRPKMVQTEKQYLYIHECINDYIIEPPEIAEVVTLDPIYENLEIIKSKEITNEPAYENVEAIKMKLL